MVLKKRRFCKEYNLVYSSDSLDVGVVDEGVDGGGEGDEGGDERDGVPHL